MNAANQSKQTLIIGVLTLASLALLAVIYFAPVWWVALKAPNYPEHTFPDGIRIHFHVDGVFNGCKARESTEVAEGEALDCKHEMDTINHYVGMYPIAAGAPVERAVSPFIFVLLGVMLVAFAMPGRKSRTVVLLVGCLGIAGWMSAALYTEGGFKYTSPGYQSDVMETLDLDREDVEDWTALTAVEESYFEALGRYFPGQDMGARVQLIVNIVQGVFVAMLVAMAVLVVGAWKWKPFYWLLIVVPALLPLFFVIDYSGWLWWFGHNLSDMGAFTVKPFMPTVFGDGKVAQFSTHSYPSTGFGLMMASSFILLIAALLRGRQMRRGGFEV
jgi:hypothetical protein